MEDAKHPLFKVSSDNDHVQIHVYDSNVVVYAIMDDTPQRGFMSMPMLAAIQLRNDLNKMLGVQPFSREWRENAALEATK